MPNSMVLCILIFLNFLLVKSQRPLLPALYIFGDSLSDSGNNNFLRTAAYVNYKPYGIDFPSGNTGRFCNGKTFVDFIAEQLGQPLVPPYMGLLAENTRSPATGVNYTSGSAGILPETGSTAGINLPLDKQISCFQKTVQFDLPRIFQNPFHHLSKSIFYISIGSNDYLINYLQPANYKTSEIYTPEEFADVLLNGLRNRILKLYSLGARKFVVLNIGRIGCCPAVVSTGSSPTAPCNEDANNLVLLFNAKFPSMITSLEKLLSGSSFVRGDIFKMNKTSIEAGYTKGQAPCCQVDAASGLCLPNSTTCSDRKSYMYWDAFHPTEALNKDLANDCFSGSLTCVPINVRQLALGQYGGHSS